MKKKTLVVLLAIALVAVLGVGSAIAYLTASDKAVNTFTVGNIAIDLIESQLHRSNASGNPLLASPDFADQLVPADDYSKEHGWNNTYYPDAVIQDDAKNYETYLAEAGANMVPGSNVHKMPYVINTGKVDAYVRVRVMIPVDLFKMIDNGPSMWTTTAMNEGEVTSKAVDAYFADTASFLNGTATDYIVERDSIKYYSFDFTYEKALAPEEMTFWNCWGNIRIDPNATGDDLAKIGPDGFKVLVEADGIQAEGFADATAAFTAFDAQN